MAKREAHTPEEIVTTLRQVDEPVGQGKSVAEGVRSIGVTEPTYCRWRTEFGGLKLERENAWLRKAVSDLTPDKIILNKAASRKY